MKKIITIIALVFAFATQAQTDKVTSKTFDVNGFINTHTTELVKNLKLNNEQAGKIKSLNDMTAYAIQKQLVVGEMEGKTSFSTADIAAITTRVKENVRYEAELQSILSKKQYKKYLKAQK